VQLARTRTAAAAGGSPPPEPPSGPPGGQPLGGHGRGRFWTSRAGHAVLLLMLLICALGAPAAVGGMIYASIQRPLTGALASVAVLFAAYRNRRVFVSDTDTYCGRLVYAGIAGGMVGEALTYLVFSLPSGAPTSAPWVVLFVIAIGGAIGVGFGLASLLLSCGLLAARLLPSIARGAFGRAA